MKKQLQHSQHLQIIILKYWAYGIQKDAEHFQKKTPFLVLKGHRHVYLIKKTKEQAIRKNQNP